jgi:hypothetical protein
VSTIVAGKTFTMLGPPGKLSKMKPEEKGIMPRALEQLFQALKADRSITGWKMAVTYIEVYCEVIRDLLTADKTAREDKRRAGIEVTEAKGVMHLKTVTPTAVQTMQVIPRLLPCMMQTGSSIDPLTEHSLVLDAENPGWCV